MKAKNLVFDGIFALLVIVGLSTCDQRMSTQNLLAMDDHKIVKALSDR